MYTKKLAMKHQSFLFCERERIQDPRFEPEHTTEVVIVGHFQGVTMERQAAGRIGGVVGFQSKVGLTVFPGKGKNFFGLVGFGDIKDDRQQVGVSSKIVLPFVVVPI